MHARPPFVGAERAHAVRSRSCRTVTSTRTRRSRCTRRWLRQGRLLWLLTTHTHHAVTVQDCRQWHLACVCWWVPQRTTGQRVAPAVCLPDIVALLTLAEQTLGLLPPGAADAAVPHHESDEAAALRAQEA